MYSAFGLAIQFSIRLVAAILGAGLAIGSPRIVWASAITLIILELIPTNPPKE